MSATLNGQPRARKQLSDQLDRMDGIIDALADALPGAVADAVLELLASPELRALLARPDGPALAPTPTQATTAPPKPSFRDRLRARLVRLRLALTGATRSFGAAVSRKIEAAKPQATRVGHVVRALWSLKNVAIMTVAVGSVAAVACYLAPRPVAAAVGGGGAAAATLAVQGALWARGCLRKWAMA